MTYISVFSERS